VSVAANLVRVRATDVLRLLATPLGRLHLGAAVPDRAWPLLATLAGVYRSTLVRRTRIVAVVGSLGKTTTTRAVRAVLGTARGGTVERNGRAAVALAVLRLPPGRRQAVFEVGINGPGQMRRHARSLRPDVVVVTSVASEHWSSFRTLERTRAEKAEMVTALGPRGTAVLNGDDPHVRWMAARTRARTVTFGFGDGNDVRATDVVFEWPHGMRFTLHTPAGAAPARIRLIGGHMVYAALAAVAVGLVEGRTLEAARAALADLEPARGRLEAVPLASGALLLRDDAKAPLESVDAALDVLAAVPAPRKFVVLGDVSEARGLEASLYRRLGARVGALADGVVFVTGAAGAVYRAGAEEAGLASGAIRQAPYYTPDLATTLARQLGAGDVVLIKAQTEQRLARVSLALAGRTVRCELPVCRARWVSCDACPMLERGWTTGARPAPASTGTTGTP
jgi:UDP-N-acetylmuramyl pentapeptide synthase